MGITATLQLRGRPLLVPYVLVSDILIDWLTHLLNCQIKLKKVSKLMRTFYFLLNQTSRVWLLSDTAGRRAQSAVR